MRSRLLKTTVLAAVAGPIWTQMPQLTLRLNIGRRLSLKCLFWGHEDWIRRTSDRKICFLEFRAAHRHLSCVESHRWNNQCGFVPFRCAQRVLTDHASTCNAAGIGPFHHGHSGFAQ